MNIILLGAPGSGKGTQAKLLSEKYDFKHISTGQVFRDEIAKKTELGLIADSYISKGYLVPDDITVDVLKKNLSNLQENFILDGFPRNVNQAEKLSDIVKIDRVILIDAKEEIIKERLLGRLTCINCGEIFNKINYSLSHCSKCGGELIIRGDDNEEAIVKRLEVYKVATKPLIDFYKAKKLLSVIDGNGTIPEQFSNIEKELLKFGELN